jgi:SAM-dependent methyltransferase
MTRELVKNYYASIVRQEWRRLVKDPYHRLEFETTLHYLGKYLPPGGLVLDAGGGPGRYTLELARRGYRMVLLDLVPENLAFAWRQIRRARLSSQVQQQAEGSITDLSMFEEGTFDAVLCTGGPLSHLLESGERVKAIAELVRVAKSGAPIFISVISRLSVVIVLLTEAQGELETPHFLHFRETGDYLGGHGFTAAHFFLPEELVEVFKPHPVQVLELVGLEGIGAHHSREVNRLAKNQERWAHWLETHYQTCTHPAIVGTSEHMLLVCRKE